MNRVEFFGISGSGRQHFQRQILRAQLKEKKIRTYSYKQVIEEYLTSQ